jgi:hypothetical protein
VREMESIPLSEVFTRLSPRAGNGEKESGGVGEE